MVKVCLVYWNMPIREYLFLEVISGFEIYFALQLSDRHVLYLCKHICMHTCTSLLTASSAFRLGTLWGYRTELQTISSILIKLIKLISSILIKLLLILSGSINIYFIYSVISVLRRYTIRKSANSHLK